MSLFQLALKTFVIDWIPSAIKNLLLNGNDELRVLRLGDGHGHKEAVYGLNDSNVGLENKAGGAENRVGYRSGGDKNNETGSNNVGGGNNSTGDNNVGGANNGGGGVNNGGGALDATLKFKAI